jgi:hypothetical protein
MKQNEAKFRQPYLAVSLILLVLLAACMPVIRPTDVQSTPEENSAVANVRQVLTQQLHADVTAVDVVAAVKEEWSDACLGAGRANESCAQVQTPGYQITLAVDGEEYRYHTNADGSDFRLVEAPAPAIGTRVLTWTDDNERGCQILEAGIDGVAFGPCFGTLLGAPYSFDTRQSDLTAFANEYQSFTVATVAGAVDFVGNGDKIATAAEQRMIAEWARLVALEAQGGRSGASWGLVFAWHREGGIAGFCDDVTVYVSGDAYVTSCKGAQPQDLGRLRLSPNQLQVIYDWVDTLQPFEVEQSDPATADTMTTRIVFSGAGNAVADEMTYQAISDLALALIFQVTTATPATNPDPLPVPATGAGNVTDDNPPVTTPITDTGEAIVERVEVRILEANPVQIEAVIRGQLPDACSFIQDASVAVEGNVFNIRLTTARQLAQRCIQVLTPFEQVVRLGSPEPDTGGYEVRVGEIVESFTLGE